MCARLAEKLKSWKIFCTLSEAFKLFMQLENYSDGVFKKFYLNVFRRAGNFLVLLMIFEFVNVTCLFCNDLRRTIKVGFSAQNFPQEN
jgi:hypothetical protein